MKTACQAAAVQLRDRRADGATELHDAHAEPHTEGRAGEAESERASEREMATKRAASDGAPAAKKSKGARAAVNVCMVGTGEYTTGYVGGKAADSDKGAGVVGLVMMDLRTKGKTDRLAMAGVNGTKFPGIRKHMQRNIGDVCVDYCLLICARAPRRPL